MKYLLVIVFSFFVMIMNMQNGLHLVIYEVAKPVIIKKYCENKDKPELKCNGKCHMKKVLAEETKTDSKNPVNIPPPQIKFNILTYFVSTINAIDFSLSDYQLITYFDEIHFHLHETSSAIFRPPIV
ncbi:MAG: hypothetical protein R2728_12315 [Chitinophagales bacterium]